MLDNEKTAHNNHTKRKHGVNYFLIKAIDKKESLNQLVQRKKMITTPS